MTRVLVADDHAVMHHGLKQVPGEAVDIIGGGEASSVRGGLENVRARNRDVVHETLSDREYEVLRMIASGRTVTQIAEEKHLSVKTISTYRSRLLEKMNMKTNSELTHYAIKHRLVE